MAASAVTCRNHSPHGKALPKPSTPAERLLAILALKKECDLVPGRGFTLPQILRPPHWKCEGHRPYVVAGRWHHNPHVVINNLAAARREDLERRYKLKYTIDGSPLIGLALTHPTYGSHVKTLIALIAWHHAVLHERLSESEARALTKPLRIPLSTVRESWLRVARETNLDPQTAEKILYTCGQLDQLNCYRTREIKGTSYIHLTHPCIFVTLRSRFNFSGKHTEALVRKHGPQWAMLDFEELHLADRPATPATKRTAEHAREAIASFKVLPPQIQDAQCIGLVKLITRLWLEKPEMSEEVVFKKVGHLLQQEQQARQGRKDGFRLSGTSGSGGSMTFARGSCASSIFNS